MTPVSRGPAVKGQQPYKPREIPFVPLTPEGYKQFVSHLVNQENILFHCDDPFLSYMDDAGQRVYTRTEAEKRQRCQELFERRFPKSLLLEIASQVMEEMYYQGVKPIQFTGVYAA